MRLASAGGKGGRSMGVQVVHCPGVVLRSNAMRGVNQHDFVCFWEMDVGQITQNVGVIDRGASVADRDMPPAFQRRAEHK